jgi:hypothetical protein
MRTGKRPYAGVELGIRCFRLDCQFNLQGDYQNQMGADGIVSNVPLWQVRAAPGQNHTIHKDCQWTMAPDGTGDGWFFQLSNRLSPYVL